ncbi:PTS lactose transporter subunit IIB [Microbacterium sorbitolivorans]|uniref:PTS sugar transporter subunit IIB n=1 Tax=Microbacterium sorbitolivorans TaxID=1867410 RepID=A0A367Y2P0_9MICO|nr:PTS sugar transporter subunit IIB [Microbacterium sorbitolivorans]RCK60097.1 PTS sugar transporter subunit IIB [Microbacterium sorbitolivorans]GGF42744.1 PTS lactose transporter subunit IIB [Microbacterium sorbitolivorans]
MTKKFLAVCSTGLGSSFMVHMNIEKVLKELEISGVTVDHADLGSVANGDADAVFVGRDIADAAQHLGDVVVLDSIIDLGELREKVAAAAQRHGLSA